MGGMGGEEGGMGGEPDGGTAGMSGAGGAGAGMGGKAGAGAGGAAAGVGGVGGALAGAGGAGGAAAGVSGAGGATAGVGGAGGAGAGGGGAGGASAGVGGAGAGGAGAGGAGAGGAGAGGAGMGGAGMAGASGGGAGGTAPTCDLTPPPEIYVGVLEGSQEVPPVITAGTGFVIAELNAGATELVSSIYWSGMTSTTTLGHIHGPAVVAVGPAPAIFNYNPPTATNSGSVVGATFAINTAQLGYLRGGELYANIHSVNNAGGEIRAQLVPATLVRSGTLSASQEVPPTTSNGTGRAIAVALPDNTHAIVSVNWSGMSSSVNAGHVHGPAPAGMNANPPIFDLMPPAGVAGSVVHRLWDMGANAAHLPNNLLYVNIHTATNPGGEIRAQLLPRCP